MSMPIDSLCLPCLPRLGKPSQNATAQLSLRRPGVNSQRPHVGCNTPDFVPQSGEQIRQACLSLFSLRFWPRGPLTVAIAEPPENSWHQVNPNPTRFLSKSLLCSETWPDPTKSPISGCSLLQTSKHSEHLCSLLLFCTTRL